MVSVTIIKWNPKGVLTGADTCPFFMENAASLTMRPRPKKPRSPPYCPEGQVENCFARSANFLPDWIWARRSLASCSVFTSM